MQTVVIPTVWSTTILCTAIFIFVRSQPLLGYARLTSSVIEHLYICDIPIIHIYLCSLLVCSVLSFIIWTWNSIVSFEILGAPQAAGSGAVGLIGFTPSN